MMEQKKSFSGYKIAVACAVLMFVTTGVFSTTGVFMSSIAAENGWTVGQVGVVYTWAGVAGALGSLLVAPTIIKKLTPKYALLVGCVGICIHMFWYSRATSLTSFYLSGFFGGILLSFSSIAAVNAILGNWFIRNRKTVVGAVSGVSSFGGAVSIAICGILIAKIGYRSTYMVLGITMLVVGLIINLFFLRNRPEDVGQTALGAEDAVPAGDSGATVISQVGLTVKEAIRTPAFYLAFLGCMFAMVGWMGFKSYFAALLQSDGYGMEVTTASFYTSLLNVFAAVAVIMGGRIADKMGNKIYIIYMSVALAAGILIIVLAGASVVTIPALLILAMILAALSAPNQSVTAPFMTMELFGNRDYATLSIYFIAAGSVGTAVYPLVMNALLSSGWALSSCFWVFLTCDLAALVLFLAAMAVNPMKKKAAAAA